MKKYLILAGVIIFFLILIIGGYYFTRGNQLNDLIIEKNGLQGDLAAAKVKLSKEKETLSTMTNGLRSSFPGGANIQDQMKQGSDIVNRTDFLFTNPKGLNPEIIIKKPKNSIQVNQINTERQNINTLLAAWQKETDILSVDKIDFNESVKIKTDVDAIKKYISDLSQIVGTLTPENSGLSQLQIDTYSSKLPSVESVNEVEVSITNNQILQGPPPNPPAVEPDDVVAQQATVAQMQAEAEQLQAQIAQTEAQIEQISPSPSPTPVPPPTPIPPPQTNPEPPPPNPAGTGSQGIIVQPGAPELIQGTNPF